MGCAQAAFYFEAAKASILIDDFSAAITFITEAFFHIGGATENHRLIPIIQAVNKKIKSKSGLNANKGRCEKFLKIKNDLKPYWQENISSTLKPSAAARLLERSSIYQESDTKPERSVLEKYVREWQQEDKLKKYWLDHSVPAMEEAEVVLMLEQTDIYKKLPKTKPDHAALEKYVREWQAVQN